MNYTLSYSRNYPDLFGQSYHFNGKEKDDEWTGNSGDSYDFGARMYDSRLGRWLSVDEEYQIEPSVSVYAFGGDSPILMKDINGKVIRPTNDQGKVAVQDMLSSYGDDNLQKALFGLVKVDEKGPNGELGNTTYQTTYNGYLNPETGIHSPLKYKDYKKLATKNMKTAGVSRKDRKSINWTNAYSTYLALQTTDIVEVEVLNSTEESSTQAAGNSGTEAVANEARAPRTVNSKYSELQKEIKGNLDQKTLDKIMSSGEQIPGITNSTIYNNRNYKVTPSEYVSVTESRTRGLVVLRGNTQKTTTDGKTTTVAVSPQERTKALQAAINKLYPNPGK